jgi:predicted dienelactone hydrolase
MKRCPHGSRPSFALSLLVLLLATGSAHALPDPSDPGPFSVGYLRTTITRAATLVDGDRAMDTFVWYPTLDRTPSSDPYGLPDAEVAPGRHPVLVFSHGGCAHPIASSYLNEAFASFGFVVVTPSHPGDTILDGTESCDWIELRTPTLIERVADVRFVLDVLEQGTDATVAALSGRLDLGRVGIVGWSSGASTALVAGREDPRFDAVLSLAPDVRPERIGRQPTGVPTMVMEGVLDFYDPQQTALDEIYRRLRAPRFAVEMQRTGHFAFSDDCLADLIGGVDCGIDGTLTQDEAHRVVLRYAMPFLLRWVAELRPWSALLKGGVTGGAELRVDLGRGRRLSRRP